LARIRSIKPQFWTSSQVLECSTNARLLFLGLWNFCDDEGRHVFSAKQIKAEVFPADDFTQKDILGMLDELSSNELIVRYVVDEKEYFYVSGWHHQRIDRPQPARCPAPIDDNSTNDQGTFVPDRIGKDKIGKDKKETPKPPEGAKRKSRISDDQKLTGELRDKALMYWKSKNRPDLDPLEEFEKFKNHYLGNGERRLDWGRTWQTWYTNAVQFNKPPTGGSSNLDHFKGAL